MRPLPNETDTLAERRCIITGEYGSRAGLIRLALGPDGSIAPDVRARAPGRGAWIGVDRAALEIALAKGKLKGALARAFKTSDMVIAPDLPARVEAALERNARRLVVSALVLMPRIDAAVMSMKLANGDQTFWSKIISFKVLALSAMTPLI